MDRSDRSLQPMEMELWRFARGDTPATEFAEWCYQCEALEQFLGDDRYLDVVGLDFRNREARRGDAEASEGLAVGGARTPMLVSVVEKPDPSTHGLRHSV